MSKLGIRGRHQDKIHRRGPHPLEHGVHGFGDGEARETDAALGGAIASHLRLAFYEPVQVVYMGPLFGYGLGGQFRIVPSDKRQFQIAQVVVKVARDLSGELGYQGNTAPRTERKPHTP